MPVWHINFPVLQCIQLTPLQKSHLCYFCKRFCNLQWRIQWTCRSLIADFFTYLTCTGAIAIKLAGKCTVLTTLTHEMVPTVIVSWSSVVEEMVSVEEEVVSIAGTPLCNSPCTLLVFIGTRTPGVGQKGQREVERALANKLSAIDSAW